MTSKGRCSATLDPDGIGLAGSTREAANSAASESGFRKKVRSAVWKGLWKGDLDAAVNWGSDQVMFFKNLHYRIYDKDKKHVTDTGKIAGAFGLENLPSG